VQEMHRRGLKNKDSYVLPGNEKSTQNFKADGYVPAVF